ncbi:IS481 family transposase [Frankia sp. R43]|uniref:IS481 family transposase n=1 Tax=Frankia sp. R43 TaxID=269536 RepID=UPI00350F01F5
MSVVEQRYRAVLAVERGEPVTVVAAQFGVSRQTVHAWVVRYRAAGLSGLADRSRRPESCPHQASPEVEAAVCELRREHPRWGARRLVHELARTAPAGMVVPSRMTVYRILARHGLTEPKARRRRREDYVRWERPVAMALWQMDIVGGVFLVDGTECKVVTGVDDHSRFCVIASVVSRATGRAVCQAFAGALGRFGVPEEVLTDNGKQFTDRFGHGGEVLFDRICRDNGIAHRLTQPASPTTTGKVERFHLTLRRELLDHAVPFASLADAQAAVDRWVVEYNIRRPHQALDMACPADRFSETARARQEADPLPPRLPAILGLADPAPVSTETTGPAGAVTAPDDDPRPVQVVYDGGPVEFERIVPNSGNLGVAGRQFWLGQARAGLTVTFWADHDVIHLLIAGVRIKSLRSHLSSADLAALAADGGRPAGPAPLPAAEADGTAWEIDRTINRFGSVSVGGKVVLIAEILAGRRVTIRVEPATLTVFDPQTRELLRTRTNPIPVERLARLQGARPAGPPPRPSVEPITVQRRTDPIGRIMIAGQRLNVGREHGGAIVTAHVSDTTITIELDPTTRWTFARTTSKPVRSMKAYRPRTTNVS